MKTYIYKTIKIRFHFLLEICFVLFVQTVYAGYNTNSFFVTLGERSSVVTPDEVENAKTNIECQPAENDLNGHWGPTIYGCQLSIRFNKDIFRTNEPIIAILIYRNAGTTDLVYGTPFGGDLDFQIIIKDRDGNELPDSFIPTRTTGHGFEWPPGTQYVYQSNLTRRYGLTKPGTYSVSVHRRLPNLNGNRWIDLSSGIAKIEIVE